MSLFVNELTTELCCDTLPLILFVGSGMEMMASRFQVVVTAMRKKPYDYLDQRKMDFDSDFDEFKRAIQELHVSCYAGTLYDVSHNNDEPKEMIRQCVFYYM